MGVCTDSTHRRKQVAGTRSVAQASGTARCPPRPNQQSRSLMRWGPSMAEAPDSSRPRHVRESAIGHPTSATALSPARAKRTRAGRQPTCVLATSSTLRTTRPSWSVTRSRSSGSSRRELEHPGPGGRTPVGRHRRPGHQRTPVPRRRRLVGRGARPRGLPAHSD